MRNVFTFEENYVVRCAQKVGQFRAEPIFALLQTVPKRIGIEESDRSTGQKITAVWM